MKFRARHTNEGTELRCVWGLLSALFRPLCKVTVLNPTEPEVLYGGFD